MPGEDTAYGQTRAVLGHYNEFLETGRMCLSDHVIRTWFFVQNVDANYREFVVARREFLR